MGKYRGAALVRAGFIGVSVAILVTLVGLAPQTLWSWATQVRYQAVFPEAGGLVAGNDVVVSGIKVGSVSSVTLLRGDALVTFTVDGTVHLGSQTTAHIKTGTVLGARIVTLVPAGTGTQKPSDPIPASRTSSPYVLTDVIGDLTANASGLDTATLNKSLETLSDTVDSMAPQLGPTLAGLTRLSQSMNNRNDTLRELLHSASDLAGVLSERREQVNALILNGADLIAVLAQRRQAIADLLANTSSVSRQLSALVHDNEAKLAPTLTKLNSVTEVLQKNRDNIAKALPGLAKYEITMGEAVSSGFYYQAYTANVVPAAFLQPFFDYAFGFRRGTDAGQPPDNAGPRAEFPFPYNGIPPQPQEGPR
ncbi:MCE family protein [Mycolicibacterium rhodesiae]|uniref:Mammalian cell entry protein n=1 Tax=Mycolicibacterium rhodesiae TaxID=36814 RepID=A0A1X0IK88_MYCRH|nr:MCE family protein [Mycolicibacterium rhodesiae]MCV7347032.1 MCE family protein [Mycolicibacterium rhodesiae]ORB48294.1 mammalian cell entry protein [Mycolicibacterium rhodesiae]